jgi:hypothetical protein
MCGEWRSGIGGLRKVPPWVCATGLLTWRCSSTAPQVVINDGSERCSEITSKQVPILDSISRQGKRNLPGLSPAVSGSNATVQQDQ